MIESDHDRWLFWPSLFFTFQCLVYLFFFSSRGYLAYQGLEEKKQALTEEIQNLKDEQQALNEKQEVMLDDNRASQRLGDEWLISKDKGVEIIKFKDEKWAEYSSHYRGGSSLLKTQKIYIIVAGLLQISLIIFFFYQNFKKSFPWAHQ